MNCTAHQLFTKQVLDVVSKHDGAVMNDASFQPISAHNEPSFNRQVSNVTFIFQYTSNPKPSLTYEHVGPPSQRVKVKVHTLDIFRYLILFIINLYYAVAFCCE